MEVLYFTWMVVFFSVYLDRLHIFVIDISQWLLFYYLLQVDSLTTS